MDDLSTISCISSCLSLVFAFTHKVATVSSLSPYSLHTEMFSLSIWCLIDLVLMARSCAAMISCFLQISVFQPAPRFLIPKPGVPEEYTVHVLIFQILFSGS